MQQQNRTKVLILSIIARYNKKEEDNVGSVDTATKAMMRKNEFFADAVSLAEDRLYIQRICANWILRKLQFQQEQPNTTTKRIFCKSFEMYLRSLLSKQMTKSNCRRKPTSLEVG